jgi:predicted  nucleic acid-binding Zn-ribbon protein
MKTVVDNTRRSQLYIKALYPQESERIKQGLTELEDRLSELYGILNAGKEKMDALERLPGEIENIGQIERDIRHAMENIRSLGSRYENAGKMLAASVEALDELEKSAEFERAKILEDEIHALEVKISATDSDIERLFAPLSKAISRMEKQDKNEIHVLSPENRKVLAVIKDKPDSLAQSELDPFLDELAARVKNKDLGLKDQVYDKILGQISKLKDPDTLSDLRVRKEAHASRMNELASELKHIQVYSDREKLEKDRARYTGMAESAEKELDAEKNNLDSLTDRLEISRSELYLWIAPVFGKNVEVIYNDPHTFNEG